MQEFCNFRARPQASEFFHPRSEAGGSNFYLRFQLIPDSVNNYIKELGGAERKRLELMGRNYEKYSLLIFAAGILKYPASDFPKLF